MHQIRIANEYAQYQSASAIGGISNIDLGNLRHAIFEETALRGGEMWGLLTRHPIAGYMPIVRVAGFSQGENIDVPQHVADAIAGDDDGDKIDLL
ncbi:MAG TPA: hypothetical protein PK390_01710 [Fervidobacterium nodosum]|nr:hypothetical protein [Fervidobacterium nodosum]